MFLAMASELEQQILPNAAYCMDAAIWKIQALPTKTVLAARELGCALGCFGLEEQLRGIESVINMCQRACKELEENRPQRHRSYQTLGLCAGAALVILMI